MAKWEFYDHVSTDVVSLEINPNEVQFAVTKKAILEKGATSPTGQRNLFEGRRAPQTLTFSGVTFTKAQYKVFSQWANKDYQFRLTDDLGKVYWIYITRFAPVRRRNHIEAWLSDYSIEATILDWSS